MNGEKLYWGRSFYAKYIYEAANYMAALPDTDDGSFNADDTECVAWNAAADALLNVGRCLFAGYRDERQVAMDMQFAYDKAKGE